MNPLSGRGGRGRNRARRARGFLLVLALAIVAPASAEPAPVQAPPSPGRDEAADTADLPVVHLEPRFVVTAEGEQPLTDETVLRPGQTVGLALAWPESSRPPEVHLQVPERPRDAASLPPSRPRRLVVKDPRADGSDVIEVLLLALGKVRIAPIPLTDAEGRTIALTEAVTLTTVALPDAAAGEPAPARPPVSIAPDLPGLLLSLATIALALGAALWLFRWFRGRGRGRPAAPPPPPAPPEVRALDALEALLSEGLLERNLIKPFSIRLAEIGKGYLGEIAGVGLLEATTEECGRLLRRAGFERERVRWFTDWLEELDMIKFAGDRPAADHLREQADALRAVIHATSRPSEPEPPGPLPSEPARTAESPS